MIMRPGQRLLMPVNPSFVWASLVGALLVHMVANMLLWGRAAWAPDVLSIVLVFWTVHQTRRVGMATAFVTGLLIDVYQAGLLGQHALTYTVLSYLAIAVHRRLRWFSVTEQALQVFPLFVLAHALEALLSVLAGAGLPGWWAVLAPVVEATLWPPVSLVLLAPQRRAPDPDENRPL
ncbi:MAG: rod shape-determining protein MreD [Rhodoferax sp.]